MVVPGLDSFDTGERGRKFLSLYANDHFTGFCCIKPKVVLVFPFGDMVKFCADGMPFCRADEEVSIIGKFNYRAFIFLRVEIRSTDVICRWPNSRSLNYACIDVG